MVQAVINISERTNRVLNIVKAKFGLKDKSRAITTIVEAYEDGFLEPKLRPEFVERIEKLRAGKFIKYDSVEDLENDIKNV